MVDMIYSAIFALALFFTQPAHGLSYWGSPPDSTSDIPQTDSMALSNVWSSESFPTPMASLASSVAPTSPTSWKIPSSSPETSIPSTSPEYWMAPSSSSPASSRTYSPSSPTYLIPSTSPTSLTAPTSPALSEAPTSSASSVNTSSSYNRASSSMTYSYSTQSDLTKVYHTTTDDNPRATPSNSPQSSHKSSPSSPPPKETNPPPDPGDDNTGVHNRQFNTISPLRATYDHTFDNKNGSLNGFACSDSLQDLASRFSTSGSSLFIGGAYDIALGSPNCGVCWNITNSKSGMSIHVLAIDTSEVGFNITKEAFGKLNDGHIGEGMVEVIANKVPPSVCGL